MNRRDSLFQYVVPKKIFYGTEGFDAIATNNLFITAMFAASSTKASSVDLWNNVKIPKIEYYEKEAEPDSHGWFKTTRGNELTTYSSFTGISIDGAQHETTTTDYDFHLQTEYL